MEHELPEVFVERHDYPAIRFGALEQRATFQARTIGPRPKNVVTSPAKKLDGRARKILIRQNSHSGKDRVGFVLVCEVTRIGEAREDVLSGQPRIVRENLAFGLAGCQQFKNELDC